MLLCAILKYQLEQFNDCLNYKYARMVTSVEYRHPSVDSYGHVRFTNMKHQNNNDVRTIFSIFFSSSQYSTKRPVELDATLVKYD
jgi:hypothetical protein